MDCFEVLGVERRLSLGEEEVTGAFHRLSRVEHPDTAGGRSDFENVTEAYAVLRDPVRRLKHFLKLEFGEQARDEGRQLISGDLLELFGEVGELLRRTDGLLGRKAACRTALGRAVLAKEETEAQREIADLSARLNEMMGAARESLAEIDEMMVSDREKARAAGEELARRMSYLSKWIAQVRERFAAVI